MLAGDFLKAASDSDEPLVGVGLLYQKGYLSQFLNPDGWQQERYPVNDFYTLPLKPVTDEEGKDLKISVRMPKGLVFARIWRVDVGRVKLYLLDTNIEDNPDAEYRDITDQLYGGDSRHAHPAGNPAGHRRAAGPEGPGTSADGVPHERGPLGLSGAGAYSRY